MTHLKKYWYWYALGAVALIIIGINWKKWFGPKTNGVAGTNGDGNGTGRYQVGGRVAAPGVIVNPDNPVVPMPVGPTTPSGIIINSIPALKVANPCASLQVQIDAAWNNVVASYNKIKNDTTCNALSGFNTPSQLSNYPSYAINNVGMVNSPCQNKYQTLYMPAVVQWVQLKEQYKKSGCK